MTFEWWFLATIPVFWFLQNVYHEGSHAIFGFLVEGRELLGFYPYPHKHDGRFYFARYHYGPATKDGSASPRYLAPVWAGLWVCLVMLAFFLFTKIGIYLIPATIGFVDFLWFWRGYFWGSKRCDGKRWRALRERR